MLTTANLPEAELEMTAIRASGPGGQNVNKVSTAIHLRFDIPNSSLPAFLKTALLSLRDKRISSDGVLIIKAQRTRSQEKNRLDALQRLDDLLARAQVVQPKRIPTRPKKTAVTRRLDQKTRQGQKKKDRQVKPDLKY
ncbi:MAG: aminoacyl-tRNA hydrolase [Pseudomonadales bacterium]|nr:aminoacyl-tRNA hydrolase [Pseudomonadales bacterium]